MFWLGSGTSQPIWHIESVKQWVFLDVATPSTLWTLSPKWAGQIILAVLHIWTKQPWNMEAFFAVLCIFQ
jgi:hypothetical protein